MGVVQYLHQRLGRADRSTVLSIAVVVYLFAASVTWALITPMGAVPDEPAHITYSAAVVRGDLGAFAVVDHPYYSQLAIVTVPGWVASITDPPRSVNAFPFPCFGGADELTADCAPTMSQSTRPTRVPTTVTRYPPPYYWIVGLPTLLMKGEPAVYAMRIISAALAAGMIGLGLAIASRSRRMWLALGAAIAFTPMVGHFSGSVNPSGFEITAAMGLGIGLMGIVGSERRNHHLTAWLTIALALALAWSRPRTYLVLLAVIAAAALINTDQLRDWLRNRVVRFSVPVGVTLAGASALRFQQLYTDPDRVAGTPKPVVESPIGRSIFELGDNLHELERRLTDWGLDLIGRFGWLDHSPPRFIGIAWVGLALALVLLAIVYSRRRDRAALLTISIGAVILAPLFVVTKVLNALVYQARYHLSLAVLIIIGACLVLSRLPDDRTRTLAWSFLHRGAAFAPMAMLVSIAASLHRYSVGGEAQMVNVLRLPFEAHSWLPPRGALMVAGLGVGVIGIATSAVWRTSPPAGQIMESSDKERLPQSG